MVILPSRDDPSTPGQTCEYLLLDEYWQGEYPAIFEFLSRVVVDGHPRQPSRLVVYYEEAKACMCLTDPFTGKILFHSDEGLHEAFTSLEKRLQAGTSDWRRDKKARYTR